HTFFTAGAPRGDGHGASGTHPVGFAVGFGRSTPGPPVPAIAADAGGARGGLLRFHHHLTARLAGIGTVGTPEERVIRHGGSGGSCQSDRARSGYPVPPHVPASCVWICATRQARPSAANVAF